MKRGFQTPALRAALLPLLVGMLLTACASNPARLPLIDPDPALGQTQTLLVSTTRTQAEQADGYFNAGRSLKPSFAAVGVWVPADRQPGEVHYPGRTVRPAEEFALTGYEALADETTFIDRVEARLAGRPEGERHVTVFVHGFNTPFSHGLYLNAQILADFEVESVAVHFAWPSAGRLSAYLYDRDSVEFSRDGLVHTLDLLARTEADTITLIGHSLGAMLVMESLRQLSLTNRVDVLERIGAVVLASPDIDSDVFREQVATLRPMPEYLVVFVSHRDRLLAVSSFLRGERAPRVGLGNHVEALTTMGVTVIDLTGFGDGDGFNHSTFANSPTLMSMVRSGALEAALVTDQPQDGQGPGSALAALAASIISLPARALPKE